MPLNCHAHQLSRPVGISITNEMEARLGSCGASLSPGAPRNQEADKGQQGYPGFPDDPYSV